MRAPLFIALSLLLAAGWRAEAQTENWRIYTTDNSGLPANYVYAIAIDSGGTKWLGTAMGAVKLDGDTWTVYNPENSPLQSRLVMAAAVDRNGVVWLGTSNGGVARFDGKAWSVYTSTNSALPNNTIHAVVIDSLNNPIVTTDGGFAAFDGTGWIAYNDENSGLPGNFTRGLAIDRYGSRWVGVFDAFKVEGRIGVQSERAWEYHNLTTRGMPSSYPAVIAIDSRNVKWVGTAGAGLGRLDGIVWDVYNQAGSGLPSNGVMSIAFEGDVKWIGTGAGLARFDGAVWKVYDTHNSPLADDYVYAVAVDREGRKWIGTGGGGLAVLDEGSTAGAGEEEAQAGNLAGHPNPFSGATTIDYTLGGSADVELSIYDPLGREVRSLVRERQRAGRHSVRVDAGGLPAGVYICRLRAGRTTESETLVVVR